MNYTSLGKAYAMVRLSRYTHCTNNEHLEALVRLLRRTMNYYLLYIEFPVLLEG